MLVRRKSCLEQWIWTHSHWCYATREGDLMRYGSLGWFLYNAEVWSFDRPKAAISRFCPGSCILPAILQSLCRHMCVLTVQAMCVHMCHFPGSMQARRHVISHSHGSGSVDTHVYSFLQSWVRSFFISKPWLSIKWKCMPWLGSITYFLDKLTIFPDSAIMRTILFILCNIVVNVTKWVSVVTKVHGHKWKEADI